MQDYWRSLCETDGPVNKEKFTVDTFLSRDLGRNLILAKASSSIAWSVLDTLLTCNCLQPLCVGNHEAHVEAPKFTDYSGITPNIDFILS